MTQTYKKYAVVALSSGMSHPLDYGIKEEHLSDAFEGSLVQVPLRGRLQTGIILALKEECSLKKVLSVNRILQNERLLTPALFELAKWMSHYYLTSLAKVLKLFFPKSVREEMGHKQQWVIKKNQPTEKLLAFCLEKRAKKPKQVAALDVLLKEDRELFLTELMEQAQVSRSSILSLEKEGLIKTSLTQVDRNPLKDAEFFPSMKKKLTVEQAQVVEVLKEDMKKAEFKTSLLHGVTGSGKTEVYLQLIDQALENKKTVLMLVPEIALTTQTIEKFKGRFPNQVAILHHRLSHGERYDTWHRIRKKEVSIVIGARSAIFAPLIDLGLIIVDEEHESSYKQTEEMPTYHARDLAVMRGKLEKAVVVLGSATPSFESYTNAKKGKYRLLTLSKRVSDKPLAKVQLVDMKNEYEKSGGFTSFSQPLISALKKRYEKGEQSILFLNRRGYHTSLVCSGCGLVVQCPNCDIALTFHLKKKQLSCHLCDFVQAPLTSCPKCHEQTIQYKGIGTEKIEIGLKKLLPDLRILRMDSDTTKHKGSYEKMYYAFRNQKADVLIGTQMIAKGLDFPNVTFVGVLNGDSQLNLPDFRASEQTFQLLTQVAGRAGRGESKGEVIVQTINPQNQVLNLALEQDFSLFYDHEIKSRELFCFPPFTSMMKIVFKGKDEQKTFRSAESFYNALKKQHIKGLELLAPLPCGYPKINEFYRFQILLKSSAFSKVSSAISSLMHQWEKDRSVKVLVDINPQSTFF